VVFIAGTEITRYQEISPKPRTKNFIGYWERRLQDPSFVEDLIFEIIRSPTILTIIPASVVLYLAYDHLEIILIAISDLINMTTGAAKGFTSLPGALAGTVKKPITFVGKTLFGG
jgi:hypothetical protein